MKCRACGSRNLVFEWRRDFSLASDGWFGFHEYWKCQDCAFGYFGIVKGSYLGFIECGLSRLCPGETSA